MYYRIEQVGEIFFQFLGITNKIKNNFTTADRLFDFHVDKDKVFHGQEIACLKRMDLKVAQDKDKIKPLKMVFLHAILLI